MKKIFIGMFAFGAVFCGCSNFLEETAYSSFSKEEAFKNPTLVYLNTVQSVYSGMAEQGMALSNTNNYYLLSEFSSDLAYMPTRFNDWLDGGARQALFLHTWSTSYNVFNNHGAILRVARGIYCLPKFKDGNPLFPSITDILEKIAISNEIEYCPKGEYAEYLMGLRNDLPKTIYCYTSGKVRTINLENDIRIKLLPSKRKLSIYVPKELMIAEEYIYNIGIHNINSTQKECIKAFISTSLNTYDNKTCALPNLSRLFSL